MLAAGILTQIYQSASIKMNVTSPVKPIVVIIFCLFIENTSLIFDLHKTYCVPIRNANWMMYTVGDGLGNKLSRLEYAEDFHLKESIKSNNAPTVENVRKIFNNVQPIDFLFQNVKVPIASNIRGKRFKILRSGNPGISFIYIRCVRKSLMN